MRSFSSLLAGKRRMVVAVTGAVVAAAVGYSLALAGGTTATASPTPTSDSALTAALTKADGPRAALASDLKAARALSGAARLAALKQVRAKALAGGYGAAVERRAEKRGIKRDLVVSLLPDNLQSDLTALRAAPADQHKAMRQQIMTKALAGDYGADVKAAAERLHTLRPTA
jgi:hypothetical protein